MAMLYYPENIRRFVGELSIGRPDGMAGGRDPVRFEYVDPPFPAKTAFQDFLEYFREPRKGVEMVSAAGLFSAENVEL